MNAQGVTEGMVMEMTDDEGNERNRTVADSY